MRLCYYADGRSIHTKRWMKFFIDRGHEMFLLSYAEPNAPDFSDYETLGVRYRGHTGNFHLKKFWLSWRDLSKLKKVLKDDRIDILHCHFLGTNAWHAALSGFHPYVLSVMGGDILGENWKPDKNVQEKFLTPYTLKKADLITTWSPALSRVVRNYCAPETPVELVHGGVHLEKFFPAERPAYLAERLNIPAGAKVVFSPRLMARLYNIEQIAEAANEVVEKIPNAYFIFAVSVMNRDAEYENKVREIIKSGAARENARFVETIPYDEIPDYFRLADVTISVPSNDGTPMTVMESMACRTPTVMGNLADYNSDFFENEKTTSMVEVKNPRAIAAAVRKLLQDADLSDKIALEAQRRVTESGSYESQMSKMESLYQSLMNEPKV